MNILYLHGLMSGNISPKVDWLQESHRVTNPKLDYINELDIIFDKLLSTMESEKIDFIIGSSMGGYLAYHLGNATNIPTLLFNPALTPNEKRKPIVKEVANDVILHSVVLGKSDEVINYQHTLDFLKKKKANFKAMMEESGHRTSLELFKKHFNMI